MRKYILLLPLFIAFGCNSSQPREGIKGQVFWISGNQLPGPEDNRSAHYGIQREIHIYELTTLKDVTLTPEGFFSDIKTNLVTSLTTKPDGSFKVRLPPGKYSIFVQESAGLYANLFDKNNAINPVVVKEKQYAWLPITVDYQAAY